MSNTSIAMGRVSEEEKGREEDKKWKKERDLV
jgi:hypothetical protein